MGKLTESYLKLMYGHIYNTEHFYTFISGLFGSSSDLEIFLSFSKGAHESRPKMLSFCSKVEKTTLDLLFDDGKLEKNFLLNLFLKH